ncbi:shikimate dehydrogenase [Sphingomonas fuzhouensis]|uniref:shikimate dehydrogenase n=1 Tax=Sphingomonas fuzhouensis TaxID=3106033 RepID=UPI002AFF7ED2|nr:shikimate dehydrogenase [Sphingomonas sp. SGZ-02]
MTRPYAEVIGDPIGHSKSPLIHGFWLKALGIEADYYATLVLPESLPGYFAARKTDPNWRGCNITVPHKIAALDHVEDREGVRAAIGATNTAFRDADGALVGTNTDAAGFAAPLKPFDLAGKPVTVIGAGGAGRAVLYALAGIGVGPVTLFNRDVEKGAALLSAFGLEGQALSIGEAVPPSALVVNATSLGMTGQPPLDLDLSALPQDAVVYDIVYAPLETGLLAAARARGLVTIDGLEMLIGQAAVAFERFFGAAPPRDRDAELRAILLR